MQDVKGSMIRELFKVGKKEDMISFAGGNPSLEAVPVKAIEEITQRAFRDNQKDIFMYGLSEGYEPLREILKERLSKTGMDFSKNDILIVSGAQQACDLSAKVLLNEGDGVVLEDPTFTGCLNTFRTYGNIIYPVPLKEDGMDAEALEKELKAHENIKMMYVIPSFQNPTGIVTSLKKRKKLLELAEKYNFIIFEDDPYGELRFEGEDVPTLKSMDKEGRVIYAGSFSKVMAPAMRVGFMVMPKLLTEKVTYAKQFTDVHTNSLFQFVCAEFMKSDDYLPHVKKIKKLYEHKADVMLKSIKKHFPEEIKVIEPQGGLFMMAFLPDGFDSAHFAKEALAKNVAIVPQIAFSIDESRKYTGFRLNFSSETDENIEKGIEILGQLAREALLKK